MNMKREDRVSGIMTSLDEIKRAKAPKDSFAKIQQRLADQRKQANTAQGANLNWMKIAAVITLILASNTWVVSNYFSTTQMPTDSTNYPQIVANFNLYEDE